MPEAFGKQESSSPTLLLEMMAKESNPRPLHCERKGDELECPTEQEVTSGDFSACSNACSNLEDLAKIVAAWPSLPEPIRRAMLALIG